MLIGFKPVLRNRFAGVWRFRISNCSSLKSLDGNASWNVLETQKTYQPEIVEDPSLCGPLWKAALESRRNSGAERTRFSMILPPPNITGDLHLGHALTVAIQDAICRWQYMRGRDVAWIPGLDHAGLATEMVVERHLASREKEAGANPRLKLGREAFIREIWRWKDSKKTSILDQLHRIGVLLDWNAEYFTFSPEHSKAVNEALYRLSEAGVLYRAKSLISWCCHLRSAISDIEVERREITELTMLPVPGYEEKQPFGYVDVFDYRLSSGQGSVPVATTRLETMLADTALAVHPDDARYSHLIGQFVEHPFIPNLVLPIIADADHVDPKQGTGVVKVSPGHSSVDLEIAENGRRLPVVSMLSDEGTVISESEFAGLPRFKARAKIAERLAEMGQYRGRFAVGQSTDFLAPVEPLSLPLCSRSGDVVEPLLREQWFVDTAAMAKAASLANEDGRLGITPHFHEPTWRDWLSPRRRHDWCISRQVWWGHRIPAYRVPSHLRTFCHSDSSTDDWVIARDLDEARRLIARRCGCEISEVPLELEQDSDVLDTWFSSGLLPFTAFGWPDVDPKELTKNYPLSLMETGQDILFFWVARMAMLGIHLTGQVPFKHVLLHGLICDAKGQKMSKSKGNTIDPLRLIEGVGNLKPHQLGKGGEIRSLGADALRASLLASAFTQPLVAYSEETALDYRRFANKVWQSLRFLSNEMSRFGVKLDDGLVAKYDIETAWLRLSREEEAEVCLLDVWILERTAHLTDRFNSAFKGLCGEEADNGDGFHNCVADLKFWWVEYLCSTYLEVVKRRLRSIDSADGKALDVLLAAFLCGLRLLHLLMPHLSEVLWQSLFHRRTSGSSILLQPFPEVPKELLSRPGPIYVDEALSAVSALKSWLVLLNLRATDAFSVISSEHPLTSGETSALTELCLALTSLKCSPTANESTTKSWSTISCGAGLLLQFNNQAVDFTAAERTLQSRITKLEKKKTQILRFKGLDNHVVEGLSRSELSRLMTLEKQMEELRSQWRTLLDCKKDL